MPQSWPIELPQQFDKDGYQDVFEDNRQLSQTELGPALIRSRISAMPRPIAGVMKMNHDQLVRFRKFWKTDTLKGKLPFLFPDPVFGYGWRKNWIANSGYAGATPGSPGTPPNGWSGLGTQNGIAKYMRGVGIEGGMEYVDLHFAGSPTGDGTAEVIFSPDIPSASGQVWTESAYLRMVNGDKTNMLGAKLVMYNVPTTAAYGTELLPRLSTAELVSQRYQNTATPVGGVTMTGVSPRIQVTGTVGYFMDITIRVAGVQMEKTNLATPFMPTPNDANPITRFGKRPPSPVFLGGVTWGVSMEMEILEP
jgi:hypothetical protein